MFDYHTHTTYSDGSFMDRMVRAATDTGLEGIGFADHCNVSTRAIEQQEKLVHGFNLDATYERRRTAIEHVRTTTDIRVFDAVEVDYAPADEQEIRTFLQDAGFDYAIGSVHRINGTSTMSPHPFRGMADTEKHSFIDEYVDRIIKLVSSNLFDIAAHIDVVERNSELRGMLTEEHYNRIVDAFRGAYTVPEVNAGRVFSDYGNPHPHPDLFQRLVEAGVSFTVGSDAHTPGEVRKRAEFLQTFRQEHEFDPVVLDL